MQSENPSSPIYARSPSEIESRFVDPTWSPAKTPYKKSDDKDSFKSPPDVMCQHSLVPKLTKKSRILPSYMNVVNESSVRQLVFGLSPTVELRIEEMISVKDQIYSVESNEFYRFYLDAEIDSISNMSSDIVITSKEQLLDIYKIMRKFADILSQKLSDLFADDRDRFLDMPVHRDEWAEYATCVVKDLILALDVEMERVVGIDEIVV
jgi:hypothetical protein